ncbi:hypothetical protein AB1L88_15970 [Tautonia sp. JC769]|uniref:hypothetical protein n=1 Tax=Tautonia sp. JC769 TaxID=3232135 RepID=UPI00345A5C53
MKPDLLVFSAPELPTPPGSRTPGSTVLEQLLSELTAMAFGDTSESSLLNPDLFERWEGDEATYLETTIGSNHLPEIDLSTRDGKIVIRILWPADEAEDDDSPTTGPDRGDLGAYSAG